MVQMLLLEMVQILLLEIRYVLQLRQSGKASGF
jgi:hypothetical protein